MNTFFMLYDILPPLLLLFSFGGIIAVITRAMMRLRAHEVSEEIQAHVLSDVPVHAESVIGPNKGDILIVKNRLVHAGVMTWNGIMYAIRVVGVRVKSIVPATKLFIATKREVRIKSVGVTSKLSSGMKGVQLPVIGIHEKIDRVKQKGMQAIRWMKNSVHVHVPNMKKGMQVMREQIVSKIPVRSHLSRDASVQPIIRLIHQSDAAESRRGIVSQIMQRPREETQVETAERLIGENSFDAADDILIPYIMKHATDTKAYMLLGRSAMGRGSWDEAVEIFQQVVKMSNEEVEAQALLGHSALQAGKFTMAMQALQRARDNDPENISIREDLLFIARRMDNKVVVRGVMEELEALKQKA